MTLYVVSKNIKNTVIVLDFFFVFSKLAFKRFHYINFRSFNIYFLAYM